MSDALKPLIAAAVDRPLTRDEAETAFRCLFELSVNETRSPCRSIQPLHRTSLWLAVDRHRRRRGHERHSGRS